MALRKHITSPGQLLKAVEFAKFRPSTVGNGSLPITFLDASWFLPNNSRNAYNEFLTQQRIAPSARFADIDAIKDETSPYPHMLPTSIEVFNKDIKSLGLTAAKDVVVYDTAGNFSAPRMAWMLEIYGHPRTVLLDNYSVYKGLDGATIDTSDISASYNPELASNAQNEQPFEAQRLDESRVISFEELSAIVKDPKELDKYVIIDARPAGRFHGVDPEPRPGLPSGHIPGSFSVPFPSVLDTNNSTNTFLSPTELRAVFEAALASSGGLAAFGEKQVIAMCGTGVTACVIERALRVAGLCGDGTSEAGKKVVRVYDGSWT